MYLLHKEKKDLQKGKEGKCESWAAGQKRGSISAWIVILSVYGADTIPFDLSLSELISWFMKSITGFLNNSNVHAINFYIINN